MWCRMCGTECSKGDEFCRSCGRSLSGEAPQENQPTIPPSSPPSRSEVHDADTYEDAEKNVSGLWGYLRWSSETTGVRELSLGIGMLAVIYMMNYRDFSGPAAFATGLLVAGSIWGIFLLTKMYEKDRGT